MQGETVELQVAESNLRARALYEKLGFLTVGAGECWWEI
ncbi:MAG: GNAT family N-acetyltransferase [Oscillospiraceae bacterium]